MKTEKKKKPYINNEHFYGVMCHYATERNKAQKANKPLPRIPDYVGECFNLICNRLSTKPNFINYSYRDDMIGDAIENCVAAVDSFDPDKSKNPFAYFTQIAYFAFLRRIEKEKKQAYVKHKNFQNNDLMNELIQDNYYPGQSLTNEFSEEIIRSFEEKMERGKRKKKKIIEED